MRRINLPELATGIELFLVRIDNLKHHEKTIPSRQANISRSIAENGYHGPPILVEARYLIILDGHHRVNALRSLGARWVPAVLLEYGDERLTLSSWRPDVSVTPSEVVRRALAGLLYPPKTTRHLLNIELPVVKVTLRDLKIGNVRGVIIG